MIECILVPTEFSEPSLAAIRYACELADAVDGRMILLHVGEGEPVHSYLVGERPPCSGTSSLQTETCPSVRYRRGSFGVTSVRKPTGDSQ
jgi:nucleotide-binding universal stress UspA family protein